MTEQARTPLVAVLLGIFGLVAVVAMGCTESPKQALVDTPTEVAVAPTAPASPTVSALPTPTSTPRPAPDARPFPLELGHQVQTLLDRTAQLRGTPPKQDVEMFLINRKVAIDYFRNGAKPEDLAQQATEQDLYKTLSLVPADSDIRELFLSLLGLGILGFYDPDLKAFYLVDDLGGIDSAFSRTTIVHEFTHALQDQYYDINKIQDRLRKDRDASLAFVDVIEGDAVNTEAAFSGSGRLRIAACFTIPPVVNIGKIPFVIQRELNTWYEDGSCFMKAVVDKVPNGIAGVYENLPATSEQILHPEKYLAGEGAKPVAVPNIESTLGEGWKETGRSNLGEFTLQNLLVLGLSNDRKRAQDGAAGWGGDAWALYARGDQRFVNIRTAWDTPEDAAEFFTTLRASLERRSGTAAAPSTDATFSIVLEGKSWRASRSGEQVAILVSTDASTLGAVAPRLGLP